MTMKLNTATLIALSMRQALAFVPSAHLQVSPCIRPISTTDVCSAAIRPNNAYLSTALSMKVLSDGNNMVQPMDRRNMLQSSAALALGAILVTAQPSEGVATSPIDFEEVIFVYEIP